MRRHRYNDCLHFLLSENTENTCRQCADIGAADLCDTQKTVVKHLRYNKADLIDMRFEHYFFFRSVHQGYDAAVTTGDDFIDIWLDQGFDCFCTAVQRA